jgi:hypothetical protein
MRHIKDDDETRTTRLPCAAAMSVPVLARAEPLRRHRLSYRHRHVARVAPGSRGCPGNVEGGRTNAKVRQLTGVHVSHATGPTPTGHGQGLVRDRCTQGHQGQ